MDKQAESQGRPGLTTVEVLRKARELVAKGWTQGWFAKSAANRRVTWTSPKACKFCAVGAIYAAANGAPVTDAIRALSAAAGCGFLGIPHWNDNLATKRDVLSAYRRAIAAAEASL